MPIENGQIFSVDGFKLKGNVAVKYNAANDLFDVEILTFENVAIEFINGVYFDQLIEVIDNRVELVDNQLKIISNQKNLRTLKAL